MIGLLRLFTRMAEFAVAAPVLVWRFVVGSICFNPRLGALRYVAMAAVGYVAFALLLVYVAAPLRGMIGSLYLADKIRYDAERWIATAIYDAKGDFVGTFDPRLDSRRDVNYTDADIELAGYTAHPDHKSVPVREVPDHYWRCLVHHEDRYLGGALNPYGIDLLGVLKIPYSSMKRTIARGRPSIGVGGSTLPMQFVRVIYKTPPRADEGAFAKLGRKFGEWWLAPVIYHTLTQDGSIEPLKQWAANHLWLAQRTGGQSLHGIEVTSQIVFGREAKDLTVAQQFVLASAVNKPIILLTGSEKLNAVRLDRWRDIVEVRARVCATRLIADPEQQKAVLFELVEMASGPPDPKVKPRLQAALDAHAPQMAKRAAANPRIRANTLLPNVSYGLREELKQAYGFNWRSAVRGITTSLDVAQNLSFKSAVEAELKSLQAKWGGRLAPGVTLDPARARVGAGAVSPEGDTAAVGADTGRLADVVIVAANARGEIVRFYESTAASPYFGSAYARSSVDGRYDPAREGRAVASTGKIIAAIGIANAGTDTLATLYTDTEAPAAGLETCRRGGVLTRGRRADVAFACSLNRPLEWRTAQLGQPQVKRLIDAFGFTMPPAPRPEDATPPSTAIVRGLIGGSPQRVHHLSAVVLAALTGRGGRAMAPPSLLRTRDPVNEAAEDAGEPGAGSIVPDRVIRPAGRALLGALLKAPLCYVAGGASHGTLKELAAWCAGRRATVTLHFAKTGTSTTTDINETIDTWATGGIQFAGGAAYSYVVMVGTGDPSRALGRSLHASQLAAPLLERLLVDLEQDAARQAPRRPAPGLRESPVASVADRRKSGQSNPIAEIMQRMLNPMTN